MAFLFITQIMCGPESGQQGVMKIGALFVIPLAVSKSRRRSRMESSGNRRSEAAAAATTRAAPTPTHRAFVTPTDHVVEYNGEHAGERLSITLPPTSEMQSEVLSPCSPLADLMPSEFKDLVAGGGPDVDVDAGDVSPPAGDDPIEADALSEFGLDLDAGLYLSPVDSYSSKCGAHMVYNMDDEVVGVFKPQDEGLGAEVIGTESPHRSGVHVGDTCSREIGAFLLDHDQYSGVPLTRGVHLPVPLLSTEEDYDADVTDSDGDGQCVEEVWKYGSLQKFVHNKGSSEDFGDGMFSAESVHRVGILDTRLFNMDRHLGNMVVVDRDEAAAAAGVRGDGHGKPNNQFDVVPIDHGLCLPDWTSLGEASFEWLFWKQAETPFSEEAKLKVQELSLEDDAKILRSLGIADGAVFTNVLCTAFLKRCVEANLTLRQIGEMMSRNLRTNKPSVFEGIIDKVCPDKTVFDVSADLGSDVMREFLKDFRNCIDETIVGMK